MDLINRINYTRFLGREFLTWLWYRSDLNEGMFDIPTGPVEVWFDAKLTLEAQGDLKEQNVVKAENPTEADEARAALLTGKLVAEARLRIIRDQKQWTLNVKGDTLALSGVKIPALLSREDDEQLFERFYLMEELEDLFADLYEQFIRTRLDDETWAPEVQAIRAWVHQMPSDG
ncbi:MAG: hypothetical protein EP329_13080 [Deltaproteobacteria bacterium]|nr:MAG: hypothetical protein EP329_13080 [Deltaproteobacteria bacterium]